MDCYGGKWQICALFITKEMCLGPHSEMLPRVTMKTLFEPHRSTALQLLQEKCDFHHVTDKCPSVANKMLFGPLGINAVVTFSCYEGNVSLARSHDL